MKKLERPIAKSYPPLNLFREDLEAIEEVLKRDAQGFCCGALDVQYDSIAELVEHRGEGALSELVISAREPYLSVDLGKLWAKLYVGSNSNANAGVFYQIDEILTKTRRKLWPLYSYYTTWILNGAIIGCALFVKHPIDLVVTGVLISWVLWVSYVRMRRHATIYLSRRLALNFWGRRKDDVILALISAVIGAILGAVGTLLVQ